VKESSLSTGRFLFVGFPGAELTDEVKKELTHLNPGGIILFERNVEETEQLEELIIALQELLPETLFLIDAEGGRVDRLREVLGPTTSSERLALHSPTLAYEAGRWLGHGLSMFNIHVNLAPSVDLDRGEVNNALDGRYLGSDPDEIVERARAFLHGLAAAGVGGCIKHFPGLGGATEDTHQDHAPVYLPLEELERDLQPFRELAREAGAVMVGHASYPAYDPESQPASLSTPILQGLLREELRFKGVAFSDDLEMAAFEDLGEVDELGEAAFALGCDGLLVCHTPEKAIKLAERLEAPYLEQRRAEADERFEAYRGLLASNRYRDPQLGGLDRTSLGPDLEEVQRRIAAVKAAGDMDPDEVGGPLKPLHVEDGEVEA
jgi:beta-N-acetylhexosaminidase